MTVSNLGDYIMIGTSQNVPIQIGSWTTLSSRIFYVVAWTIFRNGRIPWRPWGEKLPNMNTRLVWRILHENKKKHKKNTKKKYNTSVVLRFSHYSFWLLLVTEYRKLSVMTSVNLSNWGKTSSVETLFASGMMNFYGRQRTDRTWLQMLFNASLFQALM